MKRYRTSLPPLDTFVFFEAALRHGSFTKAADELMVSQAAVSKRIHQLESWLDCALFSREGQKLQPTPLGRMLGERVENALDFLKNSVDKLRLSHEPVIRIGAMTVIGMFWLQPRLQDFALSETAHPFSLTLNDNISHFFNADFDLLLLYGDGNFPGWQAHLLMREELVPVASQQLATYLTTGDNIAPVTLLEYRRQSPDWVNWALWRQKCPLDFTQNPLIQPCSSYTQTIGLALESKGVALGSLSILEKEIAQRRLVRLGNQCFVTGRAYYLTRREDGVMNSATTALWRALTGHAPTTI